MFSEGVTKNNTRIDTITRFVRVSVLDGVTRGGWSGLGLVLSTKVADEVVGELFAEGAISSCWDTGAHSFTGARLSEGCVVE